MMFQSTHQILASIKGRTRPDLWERVTGIPDFDPEKHSDGCSGGMSAGYAELPQEIRDRIGDAACRFHWRAALFCNTLPLGIR